MSKSHKSHIPLKDLKKDAVHEAGESALEFWDLHRTKIIAILATVIVVFSLVSIISKSSKANALAASKMLSDAQRQYQIACARVDDPEAEPPTTARTTAITEAMAQCEELLDAYPSSPAAAEALYVRGNLQALKGEYALAITDFEAFLGKMKTPFAQAQAQLAIGYAYEDQHFDDQENKELFQKAKAAYEKARDLAAGKSPDRLALQGRIALVNIARLHEIEGEYDKAKGIYEKLAKQPSMKSEIPELDEEEIAKKTPREQRADMIRLSLRASTRNFSVENIVEMRLKQLEARK